MVIIFITYQKFNVKVALNTMLTLLISNLLVIYLYDIKKIQILHSIYHKLNGRVNDFIFFYLQRFLIYFLLFMSKKKSFLNWILSGLFIFFYL
jgi:hypothetical protein